MDFFDAYTDELAKVAASCMSSHKKKKPMKKMARLVGKQRKLDVNKNKRVDAEDLKTLRERDEKHKRIANRLRFLNYGVRAARLAVGI